MPITCPRASFSGCKLTLSDFVKKGNGAGGGGNQNNSLKTFSPSRLTWTLTLLSEESVLMAFCEGQCPVGGAFRDIPGHLVSGLTSDLPLFSRHGDNPNTLAHFHSLRLACQPGNPNAFKTWCGGRDEMGLGRHCSRTSPPWGGSSPGAKPCVLSSDACQEIPVHPHHFCKKKRCYLLSIHIPK